MALSNWDTLAVNERGESIGGGFTSPLGVHVEFYKNWLYVADEKAWQEGDPYSKPTIMHVAHGDLTYKDVHITAIRGPQNGVYAVIQSAVYAPCIQEPCTKCDAKKGAWHKEGCADFVPTKHFAMVGCGVYGYCDQEWVGVTPESKAFLERFIQSKETGTADAIDRTFYFDDKTDDEIIAELAARGAHARVTPTEVIVAYDAHNFDDWIRKIDLSGALRVNQGDMFFAAHLGCDPRATEPGEAEPTIMSEMVAGMSGAGDA